jgi:predicted DNA-binding protein (UPF0251 family)
MSEEVPTPDDSGTPPAWDDDTWPGVAEGSWAEPPGDPEEPAPRGRVIGLRRGVAIAAAVTGLVLGSAVGGFLISRAATASPVAAATTASGSNPTASPSPGAHSRGGFGGPSAFFGGVNLIQDAATAIGVSEQTLQSDLQSGKTIAQVATANGKTAQAVITALVGDETTAIDNLVSSGKLTSSQASKITASLTQMVTDFVDQARPATVPGIGGGSGEQAALQAVATTIGVTASTLQSDLAAGQTIAAVAQAHSVSVSSVVSAVTTAVDSQISSLESSGRITSAEASTLTSEVQSRVTVWVNGTYPGWPFGPFGTLGGGFAGGGFFGGSWGHGPGASPSASPSSSVS